MDRLIEGATGPIANHRETSDVEIAQFISRVVPWPEDAEAPGYINLHYTFWDGDEPPKNVPWAGIPTKTPEQFMKALDRVRAQKNTRDIYFSAIADAHEQAWPSRRCKVAEKRTRTKGDLARYRRKRLATGLCNSRAGY